MIWLGMAVLVRFLNSFWSALSKRIFLTSLLFYIALKQAPVSKINPLVRANLLFGFFFSYYLLKEKTGWKSKVLGGGFIFGGLILVAIALCGFFIP
jgi:uncharacterized membrane protein